MKKEENKPDYSTKEFTYLINSTLILCFVVGVLEIGLAIAGMLGLVKLNVTSIISLIVSSIILICSGIFANHKKKAVLKTIKDRP